jgi:hypothetical protein
MRNGAEPLTERMFWLDGLSRGGSNKVEFSSAG